MDVLPVQTIPNHYPTKMDVLPKTFVNIILASKWPNASKWLVPLEPSLKWDSYFIYL